MLTPKDRTDFTKLIRGLKHWAEDLNSEMQEIKIPGSAVRSLTEDDIRELLNRIPVTELPESLEAHHEKWLQRFFS